MPVPLEKRFDSDRCIASLPVRMPGIPERLKEIAESEGLVEKPEFHISVIVTDNARLVAAAAAASAEPEKVKESVRSLINAFAWDYTPLEEFYRQEKSYEGKNDDEFGVVPPHMRRSIIQKVEMPDMGRFYKELTRLLGVEFGVPVPHITLFAWSDYPPRMTQGIGICSEQDFKSFSKGKVEF